MRVEADNQANVALRKVAQHVLEGLWESRVVVDSIKVARQQWEKFRIFCNLGDRSVLRRSKREEMGRNPVEISVLNTLVALIFIKVKVVQIDALFFLGLPDAIDNVLDGDAVISLAVSGITERHQRRVDLCDGCEGQVRRPVLNQHHVAREHASSIGAA